VHNEAGKEVKAQGQNRLHSGDDSGRYALRSASYPLPNHTCQSPRSHTGNMRAQSDR